MKSLPHAEPVASSSSPSSPSSSSSTPSITIRVKASNEDKDICLHHGATAAEAKSLVYNTFNVDPNAKTLRLIYAGKLLEPPHVLVASTFNLKDGCVVHAVFSNRVPAVVHQGPDIENGFLSSLSGAFSNGYLPVATAVDGNTSQHGFHSGSSSSGSGGRIDLAPAQTGGLARLIAERGLSDEEVAAMRSYFAADITSLASRTARQDGESEAAFIARVEEIWMSIQGPHSEYQLNLPPMRRELSPQQLEQMHGFLGRELLFNAFTRNSLNNQNQMQGNVMGGDDPAAIGSYRDLVCGMLLGFLFGGIALLCVWDRNMTYRQKVGIILGVVVSFVVNVATTPVAAKV